MERQAAAKVQNTPARSNHLQTQSARSPSTAHRLLELQRSIGNQAVQCLINSQYIQTKLQVSTPGDPSEQEADRVADTVMRMREPEATQNEATTQIQTKQVASQITPLVQRESEQPIEEEKEEIIATKPIIQRAVPLAVHEDDEEEKVATKLIQRLCTECEEEKKSGEDHAEGMVHRKSAPEELPNDDEVEGQSVQPKVGQTQTPKVSKSVAANIHAMNGGGSPLPDTTRAFFEPRFGADFSQVRLHTDSRAGETARSVNARAFTVGRDIALGTGQYAPESHQGRRLLAHELTHVVQQRGAQTKVPRDVKANAYTVGQNIMFGEGQYPPRTLAGQRLLAHEPAHTLQQSSSGVIHRQASLDIALRSPGVAAQLLGSEILDGFELNRHKLTAEHKRRLLALATRLTQQLREHQLGTVEITGHTDATGDEALNDQLGQDRADEVAAFLRRAGVPARALQPESAGESDLRVLTAKAEPRNRRVEIRFLPEATTIPTPEAETAEPTKEPVIPRPEKVCKEHPEICDPITTKPETMPSCKPTNCSAYGASFDIQPPDLHLILIKSFPPKPNAEAWFKALGDERRLALQQIFNRLCQYGLLCQVRLVVKVDSGEPPVAFLDRLFDVPGHTPSVYFTSSNVKALPQLLIDTGRFCLAHGPGASQHEGPTLREISGSDSMHISVEGKDLIEVHIDRYSPVPEHPGSSLCPNEPTPAAGAHIGSELIPEKLRKFLGLPGVQAFPPPAPPAPVPEGAVAPEPPRGSGEFSLSGLTRFVLRNLLGGVLESSRVTLRGPRRKPKPPLVTPDMKRGSPDAGILSNDVVERIRRAIQEQVSPEALLPSQARVRLTEARKAAMEAGPDEEAALVAVRDKVEGELDYADAHDVAFELAVQMEKARRKGLTWVKLDLDRYGNYGELDGNARKAVVGEIRRISLILRNYLPDRAAGVNTLVLIFGAENLAVREEIRLPGWVAPEKGLFD